VWTYKLSIGYSENSLKRIHKKTYYIYYTHKRDKRINRTSIVIILYSKPYINTTLTDSRTTRQSNLRKPVPGHKHSTSISRSVNEGTQPTCTNDRIFRQHPLQWGKKVHSMYQRSRDFSRVLVTSVARCFNTPQVNPQMHCIHSLHRTRSVESYSLGSDLQKTPPASPSSVV
jgi:hypothetical protein